MSSFGPRSFGPRSSGPNSADGLWSIPPGGFELVEVLGPGEPVADAIIAEEVGSSLGMICWYGTREDGSVVSVHAMMYGATPAMRSRFIAKAIEMQQLASERAIPGMLQVVAVDPLANAYLGDFAPMGTVADLSDFEWPLERTVRFVREICLILSRMHEAGIVHGCLRPECILLDADFNPVIANAQAVDIAAACREDPDAAVTRSPYAAPEVRKGKEADEPADVYSIGRLVHFLLSRQDPEELDEALPRLSSLDEAPSGLVRIVRRCTVRAPADRYPNAVAVAAELRRYLDGETVGLGHPKVAERYDAAQHALVRSLKSDAAAAPAAPAVRWRDPDAAKDDAPSADDEQPQKRGQPGPPSGLLSGPSMWSRNVELGVGALGLVLFAAALVGSYALGAGALWHILAILGAGVAAALVPSFGGRPLMSRVGVGLVLIAVTVFIGPVQRMSAGDEQRGLHSAELAERLAALRAAIEAGETELSALDLAGAELSGMDLGGLVLDGSNLAGAICVGTSLERSSLLNVDVSNADFTGAKLSSVNATQLIGWPTARCDDATVMPEGWACRDGLPVTDRTGAD